MRLRRFLPSKTGILTTFVLMVRLGLGFLFIMSSVPKIRQPYVFLGSVYGYELVGPQLGILIAATLPWLELLVGVCLVGGVLVGGALLASAGMGMLFTFVLASALGRHLDISCGCFSSSVGGKIGYLTLIRAIVMTLCSMAAYAGVLFLRPWRRQAAAPASAEGPQSKYAAARGRSLPLPE